ncbi:EAL domain-containing protein [Butyrivibrio sp. VCB2006]|uniref:EAL domain-containing protein n=1 Tax=Butyrivibrio sp. VCB2006 TaxID=1280679 RepID=UPI000402239C|nr:EAL domain-containing protein [Butyrivibrio sp. VCB2006]
MADISKPDVQDYVVNKIDEAIQNEWIKVYYQPVVRSITGELCGCEALARWIDPEIGFLSPYEFIGALEKHDLIYKLDCYVLEHVCWQISKELEDCAHSVPTSINFSRLDFIKLDMVEVVENLVKKYDIPRDMLHIEITESMIVSDEELMARVISDFRKAGYEIWMDDFGSGYSSLTLLKDYDFDLLKLDMRFLSTFNEKAQSLIRSTVSLAKDLGIKTLAEGVETKEHFEFLKSIGCGKIQGYYFGKPMPQDEFWAHIIEQGLKVEERQWRSFYEVASLTVRETDAPLALMLDNGEELKTLFINQAYRNQISFNAKIKAEEIDEKIFKSGSPLAKKYREIGDIIEKSGNLETFYWTYNGRYLRFRGQCIAKHNGSYIVRAEIHNITQDEGGQEAGRLDAKLRDLNLLYELVDIINVKNRDISPLMGKFRYIDSEDYIFDSFENTVNYFVNNFVFPSQRERFKEFLNLDVMKAKVQATNRGHIEEAYRIKQKNGAYEWRECVLMMIPGTDGEEYLFGVKSLPIGLNIDNPNYEEHMTSEVLRYYGLIWENLIWNSRIKFFWKDKQRRFMGVSQSFLDFYGIKSKDDIVGKTDEDMHWHIDDFYMNRELEVMSKGISLKDEPGQCIVRGVMHNIMCNKMPIYNDGEIIGLFGYFIDTEEELSKVNGTNASSVDTITGLMNARGILDTMIGYAIQYDDNDRNYGIIMVDNKNHDRIIKYFGKIIANDLMKEIGKKIVEVTGQSCSVGRPKGSIFTIITDADSREELQELTDKIVANVNTIREIDGSSVTLRIESVFKLRSEEGLTAENMYQIVMEMIEKA